MKILFLLSRFLDGGIDTVAVEYLNALCRYTEHEVRLVIAMKMNEGEVYLSRLDAHVKTSYLIHEDWLTAYKRGKRHGKKNIVSSIGDELMLNPIRRMLMKSRLKEIAKDADVVIDFDSCQGNLMSVVPEKAVKLAWFHFSIKKEAERSPRRMERLRDKFLSYDKIILIADSMMHEAQEYYPELSGRFVRLYNSVDKDTMQQKAQEAVNDARIDKPFILSIERLWEEQKDLTTLINAYEKLWKERKGNNTPYLYIIGEGGDRQKLQRLIDGLGLHEQIQLLGFISNPYPWIKKAELVVHSSKFEGLPTVLIESLLMDKYIICTDCPTGPSEILNGGRAGTLVPVGDANAMAEAISKALDEPEFIKHFLENARQHSKLFLPKENIETLFRDIIP